MEYEKINYSLSEKAGRVQIFYPEPPEPGNHFLPLALHDIKIGIVNKGSGLKIEGKRANGEYNFYSTAQPLKSNPEYFACKILQVINGEEFTCICLFHPFLLQIETRLTVYYIHMQQVDDNVSYEGINKGMVHDICEEFLNDLEIAKTAPITLNTKAIEKYCNKILTTISKLKTK